jgi:hypothetical protein
MGLIIPFLQHNIGYTDRGHYLFTPMGTALARPCRTETDMRRPPAPYEPGNAATVGPHALLYHLRGRWTDLLLSALIARR